MLDRGIAVASFSEAVMPAAMRDTVVRLMPLPDWYLILFRQPRLSDPRAEIVENFLKDSVIKDPTYPANEIYDDRG